MKEENKDKDIFTEIDGSEYILNLNFYLHTALLEYWGLLPSSVPQRNASFLSCCVLSDADGGVIFFATGGLQNRRRFARVELLCVTAFVFIGDFDIPLCA